MLGDFNDLLTDGESIMTNTRELHDSMCFTLKLCTVHELLTIIMSSSFKVYFPFLKQQFLSGSALKCQNYHEHVCTFLNTKSSFDLNLYIAISKGLILNMTNVVT